MIVLIEIKAIRVLQVRASSNKGSTKNSSNSDDNMIEVTARIYVQNDGYLMSKDYWALHSASTQGLVCSSSWVCYGLFVR